MSEDSNMPKGLACHHPHCSMRHYKAEWSAEGPPARKRSVRGLWEAENRAPKRPPVLILGALRGQRDSEMWRAEGSSSVIWADPL